MLPSSIFLTNIHLHVFLMNIFLRVQNATAATFNLAYKASLFHDLGQKEASDSFSHSIVFISVNIFIAFVCHCFLFFSLFRHKCFYTCFIPGYCSKLCCSHRDVIENRFKHVQMCSNEFLWWYYFTSTAYLAIVAKYTSAISNLYFGGRFKKET